MSLPLSETDWIYNAGFFDGESNFSVVIRKNKSYCPSLGFEMSPHIIIANCDKDVILYIQRLIGGAIRIRSPKNRPRQKRTLYELTIPPNPLRRLLPKILPYLRVKRKHALLLIEFLELSQKVGGRRRFDERTKRQLEIVLELRRLNTKNNSRGEQFLQTVIAKCEECQAVMTQR